MDRRFAIAPFALALAFAACGDDSNNGTDGAVDATDTAADTVEDTAPDTAGDTTEDTTADTTEDTTADTAEDTTADTTADTAEDTDTSGPACEPTDPPCQDEQILDLGFNEDPTGGSIGEEGTEPGVFISHIDATAGGFNGTLGYTYAKFTDEGLAVVDISDEESLESTDWDIAARRFILRLNSGVSGPSCVVGGRTVPGTTFEGLTTVPVGVTLRAEQYYDTDACEYVPDTSGIGSPQTVLSSFWSYPGCVAMTGNIYVVRLASGRHVKLQVLSYYTPNVQDKCDADGEAPSPNGSGNLRVQWAFLD